MKIKTFEDVEKYLQYKQVYFRIEIVTQDFKTITDVGRVCNVQKVEAKRLNSTTILLSMKIDGKEANIYEYKDDSKFFEWVKKHFIPLHIIVDHYLFDNETDFSTK